MTEITAAAVKALRERTGAGMMECKRALQEAGGDQEAAIDILRKSGAAKAAKRAARDANEGTVVIARDDDSGAVGMVEVASETDFVARNEEFQSFARRAAEIASAAADTDGPRPGSELLETESGAPLAEELERLRSSIGENLELKRYVRFGGGSDSTLGSYLHFGNRIGVVVEIAGNDGGERATSLARDVAMHVAATDPLGVSPEDIPEEERERERRILIEQAEGEGKPPEIAEKIVEGRMRKFYEQHALLEQPFVRDPDRKVASLVEEAGPELKVARFARFEVGA